MGSSKGKSTMGPPITGHVDLVFPSQYLKAADLRGREVTIIIAGVNKEHLVMAGGVRDIKPAITMTTVNGRPIEKRWIIPKTVAKQIAATLGEKRVEKWIGHRVSIYPTTCKGQRGEEVDCIRVKVRVSQTQEEPPAEMTAPVEQPAFIDDDEASDGAAT